MRLTPVILVARHGWGGPPNREPILPCISDEVSRYVGKHDVALSVFGAKGRFEEKEAGEGGRDPSAAGLMTHQISISRDLSHEIGRLWVCSWSSLS